MATAATIHGRGALFVRSSLSRPDLLDETAYIAWYENDHIAEVTSTSGIRSARRFVSVDPKADKPYLAMYPMEDIAFTQSQEFRNIRVKSNMLPDDHAIYDLADFDVRYDNLIHVYNHREARGGTNIIILVISQLKDPSEGGISSDELDRWYREECCPLLQKHKGYVRTTRFKLAYARNNHQSRVLKGLASSTDEPPPQPGTWLALHEFDCESDQVKIPELKQLASSPWTEKVSTRLARQDVHMYRLANEFGKKDWFYDVKV